jgi:cephalosporin hydroxylase
MDDRAKFETSKREWALEMALNKELEAAAVDLVIRADAYNWSYQWTWLGLPVIQMPPDVLAVQEIIWSTRPQLVIETGVARGGSLVLSATVLEILGEGRALGIDIDLRSHNRLALEKHPLSKRIDLIEGSSTDPAVIDDVVRRCRELSRIMVILDSNHSHEHVLKELSAYAPLVTVGQYLVVADTIVEHMPEQVHRPREWGPGNNPATALAEFLRFNSRFEADTIMDAKLLITSTPGGYLRCRS